MNDNIRLIIYSALGGFVASFVYLIVAYVLDFIMKANTSNLVSLLITAFINFILQFKTFMKRKKANTNILIKYIITTILDIIGTQVGVMYLLKHKDYYSKKLPNYLKEHYNTIVRIIISTLLFFLVSFPLRKYWVFI